jgi:hypothetical protein
MLYFDYLALKVFAEHYLYGEFDSFLLWLRVLARHQVLLFPVHDRKSSSHLLSATVAACRGSVYM